MSPIARASSAVNTILGNSRTMSRSRQRGVALPNAVICGLRGYISTRRRDCFVAALLAMTIPLSSLRAQRSNPDGNCRQPHQSHLGRDDFVPHFGELRLVAGPHLLLGDLPKGADIGGVDGHPLGFEQFL